MQCYGLNYCLWSASLSCGTRNNIQVIWHFLFKPVWELSARSPPCYHSQRSWLLSLGCALVLFGFGVTAGALIVIAVHPELNDLSINQTHFYKQRPKTLRPQTSYMVCGSHTQSLNERSKCGSDNSARKYIAVDQNNERYLFPDVWSISTVDQITQNDQTVYWRNMYKNLENGLVGCLFS